MIERLIRKRGRAFGGAGDVVRGSFIIALGLHAGSVRRPEAPLTDVATRGIGARSYTAGGAIAIEVSAKELLPIIALAGRQEVVAAIAIA